jgi:FtsP/CotA-like multicopper oxidase with cupredoxin domain
MKYIIRHDRMIGSAEVKMLAYNGSVPGPTLKVQQGAEVAITVTNQIP